MIHASNNPFPCGSSSEFISIQTPIENSYPDVAAMLADQSNQTQFYFQFVEDASADPNVSSSYAYYEYKGTTLGTLEDYRLLSPQEVINLVSSTILNEVKVVSVLETETTSVPDIGVAVRYSGDDVTELVFNQVFSKYLQAFLEVIEDKKITIKLFNKTTQITLIADVESITNNTEGTNVYTKLVLSTGMLVENIAEGDVLLVDLDLRNKDENIQSLSYYNQIPLKEGLYKLDGDGDDVMFTENTVNYINSGFDDFASSPVYIERQLKLVNGNNKYYKDSVYDQFFSFRGVINIEDLNGTTTFSKLEINRYFLKENFYMPILDTENSLSFNSGFRYYGKIKKFLEDSDFDSDGYLKMPYGLNEISIESYYVRINNKKVTPEFIYVGDSVNETVTLLIIDLNGYTSKDNALGTYLEIEFEYYNVLDNVEIYKPLNNSFVGDIGTSIVNLDNNLTHNNRMLTWFDEMYDNVSSGGTPPTSYGYGDSNLTNDLDNNQYREDALFLKDADIIMSAKSSSAIVFKTRFYEDKIIKIAPNGSNSLARIDNTSSIDDFLYDTVIVTSREETDNDGTDPEGTSYGFGVEFNEPTRQADLTAIGLTPDIDTHQQSPATAIVTAKFKWLRNETGAPWGLIREACRATASNAGSYNIYRGFGQIDTAAAKTYIESNIDTWSGVNTTELAEYYDAISPYNTAVTLEEKTDKTPVVKKDLVEELQDFNSNIEANFINKSQSHLKDKFTQISGGISDLGMSGLYDRTVTTDANIRGDISLNIITGSVGSIESLNSLTNASSDFCVVSNIAPDTELEIIIDNGELANNYADARWQPFFQKRLSDNIFGRFRNIQAFVSQDNVNWHTNNGWIITDFGDNNQYDKVDAFWFGDYASTNQPSTIVNWRYVKFVLKDFAGGTHPTLSDRVYITQLGIRHASENYAKQYLKRSDLVSRPAPSSSNSQGLKGDIIFTQTHVYFCYETNSWVRSSLTSW